MWFSYCINAHQLEINWCFVCDFKLFPCEIWQAIRTHCTPNSTQLPLVNVKSWCVNSVALFHNGVLHHANITRKRVTYLRKRVTMYHYHLSKTQILLSSKWQEHHINSTFNQIESNLIKSKLMFCMI